MKITHTTSAQAIEKASRLDLIAPLTEIGIATHKLTKAQMVELALKELSNRKKAHADELDGIEAQRQGELAVQRKNPIIFASIVCLLRSCEQVEARILDYLLQCRIAADEGDVTDMAHNVSGRFERMLLNTEQYNRIHPLVCYLEDQKQYRSHTIEQIQQELQDVYDDCMRSCLEDGYRYKSTCPVTNLKIVAKFHAMQLHARLLKQFLRSFNENLKQANPNDCKSELFDLSLHG